MVINIYYTSKLKKMSKTVVISCQVDLKLLFTKNK
jgi:hypothetical protein